MTETETSKALVLPATGEVVDLTDEKQVAVAYSELQTLEARIASAKRALREALAERAKVLGTKTFSIPGLGKVEVKGGTETVYDAEAIEKGLRRAGMPEDRISEIVEQVVTYKVIAVEAKRAAAANPKYDRIIKRAREIRESLPLITISRGR